MYLLHIHKYTHTFSTRVGNVLDVVFSSQNELVDNVKICEPLGSSDHNQIHFSIKAQTGNTGKKLWRRNINKGGRGMRQSELNISFMQIIKNIY